jgi:hypothetical protein
MRNIVLFLLRIKKILFETDKHLSLLEAPWAVMHHYAWPALETLERLNMYMLVVKHMWYVLLCHLATKRFLKFAKIQTFETLKLLNFCFHKIQPKVYLCLVTNCTSGIVIDFVKGCLASQLAWQLQFRSEFMLVIQTCINS